MLYNHYRVIPRNKKYINHLQITILYKKSRGWEVTHSQIIYIHKRDEKSAKKITVYIANTSCTHPFKYNQHQSLKTLCHTIPRSTPGVFLPNNRLVELQL